MTMGQSSETRIPSRARSRISPITRVAGTLAVVGGVLASALLTVGSRAGGVTPLAAVLTVLVALILALGLFGVGLTLAGVDADAEAIADRLADDDVQQRLLARWLERARWARFVGGLAGVIAWVLGSRFQGNILVFGSLGIAAGAALAEVHHAWRPTGARAARLEVRSIGDYLSRNDAIRMAVSAVVGVIAAIVGVLVDRTDVVAAGVSAALVVGVVHLLQRRVASRARPAVGDSLRRADDLVRTLAIGRGLALPATYAALALDALALTRLGERFPAATALGVIAWLYALLLWWRNRRLGLAPLLDDERERVPA